MTPVIPSSVNNITLIPGNASLRRKNDRYSRCGISRTWPTCTSFSQGHSLPLPSSIILFPRLGYGLRYKYRSHILSATGTDVVTEEQDPPAAEEDSTGSSEITPGEVEMSEQTSVQPESSSTPAQARRSRSTRKSEMPPIKNEDLVPGATFTGKVRSIQPFGAFVDFGAFTDGLVHVSQLSDRFVKDVGSIVSVGQEVKVRLLEANNETGRISLTMREGDDTSRSLQRRDAPASGDRPRSSRKSNVGQKRDEAKKSSKFVKGQDLKGTVKNLARSGAFISLPEGEEGFLPASEESDDGFVSMMGGSSLEVGQEVDVRVLRISRGQVTLTMKKEEDLKNLDAELSRGVVHAATNPFVLAFRNNKEISAFLNEREILEKPMASTASDEIQGKVGSSETSSVTEVLSQPEDGSETIATVPSTVNGENAASSAGVDVGDIKANEDSTSSTIDDKELEIVASSLSQSVDGATQATVEEAEISPEALTSESSGELIAEEASPTDESGAADESVAVEAASIGEFAVEETAPNDETTSNEVPESSGETTSQLSSSESPSANEVTKSELESVASSLSQSMDDATQATVEEAEVSPEALTTEGSESSVELVAEEASPADESVAVEATPTGELVVEDAAPNDDMKSNEVPESSGETTSQLSSSESPSANEVTKSELESVASSLSQSMDDATQATMEEAEVSPETLTTEGSESSVELVAEEASPADELLAVEATPMGELVVEDAAPNDDMTSKEVPVEATPMGELVVEDAAPNDDMTSKEVPESSGETTSQLSSSESSTANEVAKSESDSATEEEQIEKPKTVDEVADGVSGKGIKLGTSTDENGGMIGSDVQTDDSSLDAKGEVETSGTSEITGVPTDDAILSSDSQSEEVEETKLESLTSESLEPISSGDPVVSSGAPVEDVTEKNGAIAVSNGNASSGLPNERGPKASISPALVKQLREETGAGMMDCKKALSESGGDIVKAQEFLRKKGLASAEKKASRATAEGRIGSYVHDSRIGVLIEVNCETDFVSRGDIFKELVDDLAMQVAACPQVQYLVTEDVPEEIVSKERDIEMQKEDLLSKPEQIRAKIVEGRIKKRLEELALLEQPYIKNDKIVVKDYVKQTIATIGENIKVRRFVRFNLGEGLEKKSQDFAAEVAAQTTAKPQAPPKQEEPVAAKAEETIQKPPTVAVSAALVKQLREETGAGMMDCKKALSETGGNLEKAQEYLRKKGLSTADKKSSRLAAEGRIGCYIHDSRIGVMIEVNSETDFVGRSEKFKELVDDLAMQVVACPQVEFVSVDEIPESTLKKEKELEMQREDLQSKPENIREKIVEGRVSKRLGELALLEQPFIKNDSLLVKDLVKQTVAALGENIKVRRFIRFTLGETIEDAKAGDE